ncbi:MAG: hypothetical protein O7G29_11400, partial [Acidobacteria bacterium]|nr:hypothetical protein [Acidobacteriota bacterium]
FNGSWGTPILPTDVNVSLQFLDFDGEAGVTASLSVVCGLWSVVRGLLSIVPGCQNSTFSPSL